MFNMNEQTAGDNSLKNVDFTNTDFDLLYDNMISPFSYYKMVYDDNGNPIDYIIIAVNKAFEEDTGLKREQIYGKRILEIYPATEKYWIERFGRIAKTGVSERFINYSSAMGRWYEVQAYSPHRGYAAITVNDVTLVYYNSVTQLPNRNAFEKVIQSRIASEQYCCGEFAIVLLDLDNFEEINTSFGGCFGEHLLMEVSKRLQQFETDRCDIYSYRGDEFILYIKNIGDICDAEQITSRILDFLKEPLYIDGNCFYLSASCGIVSYPCHGTDIEDLLMRADLAKYRAKEHARGFYCIYDESIETALLKKVKMQTEIRRALERDEFFLCYQPLINAKTLQIIGFEALIRWNSPEYGLVQPLSFIKIAEENRMIIPIGEWVLRKACEYIRDLNEQLKTNYIVSVNISAVQMLQDDFVDRVIEILSQTGLKPEFLELEITESVFFDSLEKTAAKTDTLNSYGIKVVLDDFGTGYSSLSELKDLAISALKIDKSFIDDLPFSEKSKLLINAIIIAGHAMGLEIVAEGVETPEQQMIVTEMTCDRIQGYKISKPLHPDNIMDFLNEYHL